MSAADTALSSKHHRISPVITTGQDSFPAEKRMTRLTALTLFNFVLAAGAVRAADSADWSNVFLDKQGTRYSTLDQINRSNVTQLKVAWVYRTGDMAPGRTIECTPIVIGGVMYITTVNTNCVALDAAT